MPRTPLDTPGSPSSHGLSNPVDFVTVGGSSAAPIAPEERSGAPVRPSPSPSGLPPGSPDPEKARKAARDPHRPGQRCGAPPGEWFPRVDPSKCEGKADCAAVCPYSVFEIGTLTEEEYRSLGWFARLKADHHDRRTSRTPAVGACRACGLCVVACPEDAITLFRSTVEGSGPASPPEGSRQGEWTPRASLASAEGAAADRRPDPGGRGVALRPPNSGTRVGN